MGKTHKPLNLLTQMTTTHQIIHKIIHRYEEFNN
jgi:hypothetical protein